MVEQFFTPSIIKIIIHLKEKNNNINQFAREMKMIWSQVKKPIQLLYMYGFVEMYNTGGSTYFNLTHDGIELQKHFLQIKRVINRNKKTMLTSIMGYKDKHDLLKDIDKDIK